jgi:hypothetical protein
MPNRCRRSSSILSASPATGVEIFTLSERHGEKQVG